MAVSIVTALAFLVPVSQPVAVGSHSQPDTFLSEERRRGGGRRLRHKAVNPPTPPKAPHFVCSGEAGMISLKWIGRLLSALDRQLGHQRLNSGKECRIHRALITNSRLQGA
jgi:hypothetical protein